MQRGVHQTSPRPKISSSNLPISISLSTSSRLGLPWISGAWWGAFRLRCFPIDVQLTPNGPDVPFASEAGSLFIDARPQGDFRQIVEVKCP